MHFSARNRILTYLIPLIMACLLNSCSTIPKGVSAVSPFDSERYLGTWYEIARFDFRFEKGLNNTTANYSLNANGSIKVVNKGYDYVRKTWKEATGKAKFVGDKQVAKLKVSFFGLFYAGYNVIAIDPEYRCALVSGSNLNYLWILSRTKIIPSELKTRYLQQADSLGYDTSKLIWVEHD
jgi:apolipoprotein D and lipocalin family protein